MNLPAYTVSRIAEICNGKIITSGTSDPVITDILIDSRRLIHAGQCLFVALVSEINDGHKYIGELYEKGVRCFLVEEPGTIAEGIFIVVENTLSALQELGRYHRHLFDIPVIGITGSNGKTIVKEWLFQLMCNDYRIVRSPKSYNSQIGVPLSVWKMSKEHSLAIFEAGISKPGEMVKLQPMIDPSIGIFTNIGHAHDENFTDLAEKIREKLKLFHGARRLICCADHDQIIHEIRQDSRYDHLELFTWGRQNSADIQVVDIDKRIDYTHIRAVYPGGPFNFSIPFTDDASIENALHVMATLLLFGYPAEKIADYSTKLTPIAMRLELKEAINHCSLINDSYNSDFNSLSIALDFLHQQDHHKKKTVILSDILQTGKEKTVLFKEISELLVSRGIDRIIGIGRDMVKYGNVFPMEHAFYLTTDEFIAHFPFSSFQNQTILLKGARLFEFEKISQLLQQKAHETVMEINLDALTHNLNYFRSLLSPGTKVMAMVKAFSYGSGSFEIANLLQYHRVDYLAVAYADEGVELRTAGIRLPVMVMSPEEQGLETILKFNLEPEIYNIHILGLLEEAMNRNVTSIQQEVMVHIKIDTGMHRLGFQENEIDDLIHRLTGNPNIRVQSVFSHLAASEDKNEDEFTLLQIERFKRISDKIEKALDYPVLKHILNSAGISRFSQAQFDMVRLGIGLYGVGHDEAEQKQLRNVSTLRSVITQIKKIPPGDTIGYNRKAQVTRETLIGIVPVGYADGLDRRLGNGVGKFRISGFEVPVIGNVCMDLTMIDLTDISESVLINEGIQVTLFDDLHPVAELAKLTGTIPYEILTGISRRVKRVYYYE